MSLMTDMVVFAAVGDGEAIARLNAWCTARDAGAQQFKPLDTAAAGGNKVFCSNVWAMCGNYFPVQQFVEAFPTFGWQYPEDAVLLIDHEHDDQVRVIRAVEVGPPLVGWERLTGERAS